MKLLKNRARNFKKDLRASNLHQVTHKIQIQACPKTAKASSLATPSTEQPPDTAEAIAATTVALPDPPPSPQMAQSQKKSGTFAKESVSMENERKSATARSARIKKSLKNS